MRKPDDLEDPDLLRIASYLQTIGRIEPSAASFHRIRVAILRPVRRGDSAVAWLRFPWRRPVMAFAIAAMLLALCTTSVFASASALPDNPLYPVRNIREDIQIQLAGSNGQRARLYASFAAERTAQLRALFSNRATGSAAVVSALLRDITNRVQHANQDARDDGHAAQSSVRATEGEIGQQLTEVQQEGALSAGEQDSLSNALQAVESGQAGQNGSSNQSGGNDNQP